jgi:outer membrane protein insertion porin family
MFFFFVIGFEFGFALPGMLEPTSLKVWRIEFEGNVTYNPIVLQEVIALESMSYMERWFDNDAEGFDFSESEAQKDVIRLQRFYQRRGFSDVSVSVEIYGLL